MLKNYITTAINNLLKNKLYSAINIIGLAIGLAAFLLITLYIQKEFSYDKHWEKADLIYRVNNVMSLGGSSANAPSSTSAPALPALKKYFPDEIEFGTRIWEGSIGKIRIGDENYTGLIPLVDKDFINIFQCKLLKGNLEMTFQDPGNIALSEESAKKYFGDRDPIGEVITFNPDIGNIIQYKVTAVYRFISPNTTLNVPCFSLLTETKIGTSHWWGFSVTTYIRFNDSADIKQLSDQLPSFVNQVIPAHRMIPLQPDQKMSDLRSYSLQKMSDIYFDPVISTLDPPKKTGSKTVIAVFTIISSLVLIIACINFVILTTAKSTQRSREVAMRKTVGARFKHLLIQFLGESLLVTLLAILCAVVITELVLPFFEMLIDNKLNIPYSSPKSYIYVVILLLSVGFLGGLYPSLILSRLSPTRALKANQTTEASGSFKLRNILVVFQFTTSIILIIATVIAYFQLHYADRQDPGFNPDNLLVVETINIPNKSSNINTFQQELLKLPTVNNVALSTLQSNLVGTGRPLDFSYRPKTKDPIPAKEISFKTMFVNYNFFETYEVSLLSGRYFSKEIDQEEPSIKIYNPETKKDRKIVINSAAARQLGYASADEAVGKILEFGAKGYNYSEYTIIGVVKDSQYRNLRLKPAPEVYRLCPVDTVFLTIKYNGDYQTAVEEVRRVWNSVAGDVTFIVSNVKQNLATTFAQEEKENKVLVSFALLAIFIACMGLFGMAAFTVERRVKEIGLRKVMGAKVKDIVNLLGWNFLKPVLIANIIAWPIAILAMQRWLERFPYRFNSLLLIPICLASGLIALAIAWFTVAGNTKRVAKSKPVNALRYE